MSPPTPAPSTAPRVRPTIADVAAEAGVSKATVSRYFNHRERLLSPDIAARVEAAIAKLAYVPSPMAQALSHGRSRLIGLVVADITNPYSVAVLRGAEKACQDAGYLVMLFNLGNDRERERAAIDALASYQVDGFILNTLGQGEGQADVNTLHGKPAVLVDRRHAGLAADFVSLDNQGAMREACAHLQQQGWQRLLYITQPLLGVSSRIERTEAFRALVSSKGSAVRGAVLELAAEQGDEVLDQALTDLLRQARPERGGPAHRCHRATCGAVPAGAHQRPGRPCAREPAARAAGGARIVAGACGRGIRRLNALRKGCTAFLGPAVCFAALALAHRRGLFSSPSSFRCALCQTPLWTPPASAPSPSIWTTRSGPSGPPSRGLRVCCWTG